MKCTKSFVCIQKTSLHSCHTLCQVLLWVSEGYLGYCVVMCVSLCTEVMLTLYLRAVTMRNLLSELYTYTRWILVRPLHTKLRSNCRMHGNGCSQIWMVLCSVFGRIWGKQQSFLTENVTLKCKVNFECCIYSSVWFSRSRWLLKLVTFFLSCGVHTWCILTHSCPA